MVLSKVVWADMRRAVSHWLLVYAHSDCTLVDLGCGEGDLWTDLIFDLPMWTTVIAVDNSVDNIVTARATYSLEPRIHFLQHDVDGHGFPRTPRRPAGAVAINVLHEISTAGRQRLVTQAYERIEDGGVLIIVEPVIGSTRAVTETITPEDFVPKDGSVPLTAGWNEDMLRGAGFVHVECFWRNQNYAGWAAVK